MELCYNVQFHVLMLDEYQDINEDGFELLKTIYQKYEKDLRVIAVGDDDHCIMQHGGANIKYIDDFKKLFENDSFKWYELLTNYRSDKNIVEYSNKFINSLEVRYKTKPLKSISKEDGKVVILAYQACGNLTNCVYNLIRTEEKKDLKTLILAHTNDEVLEVYSNLKANYADIDFTARANFANYEIFCNYDAKIKIYPQEGGGNYLRNNKSWKNYYQHLFGMKGAGNLKWFTIFAFKPISPKEKINSSLSYIKSATLFFNAIFFKHFSILEVNLIKALKLNQIP